VKKLLSGNTLRVLRAMRSMTVNELARAVGLSRSYLSMIEENRRRFPTRYLRRFLDALGVDVDDVLEIERQVQRLKEGKVMTNALQDLEAKRDELIQRHRQLLARYDEQVERKLYGKPHNLEAVQRELDRVEHELEMLDKEISELSLN